MLSARDITYRVEKKPILHEVNFSLLQGEFATLMGQNGAGKSSLLKILSGVQKYTSGEVTINDRPIKGLSLEDLARQRAVLSQHYHIAFTLTVEQVVMMGRYPYFKGNPSHEDITICRKITELLKIEDLWQRDYNTLSGGEAQKVQMARVLAQIWEGYKSGGKMLLLDEPIANLDIRYQHEILRIASGYAHTGNGVLAVLHDVNLALRYSDRIYFMKQGEIVYEYLKGHALEIEKINKVFDTKFRILRDNDRSYLFTE